MAQMKTLNGYEIVDQTARDNINNILNKVYPIGSIYTSINSTNPSSLFGGTWEQIQGKFLLGCSNGYAAGSTGGESSHTLTISEMPSHTHELNHFHGSQNLQHGGDFTSLITNGGTNYASAATGGGEAHNNMPPYLAVYMWKRIR